MGEDGPADMGAQHEQRAMGEVDDAGNAEDDGQARGDQEKRGGTGRTAEGLDEDDVHAPQAGRIFLTSTSEGSAEMPST
jgi:hypothetical protein